MKIQGKLSHSFETVVGLRQDDALSTLIYLCMEKVMRNVQTNQEGTVFNGTRKCLLFTDDVLVLGCTVKHTAETIEDMTPLHNRLA